MYPSLKSSSAALFSLSLMAFGSTAAARAQQTTPTAASAGLPPYKPVVAVSWMKTPASQVTAQLSRVTGATVLVTGALASFPITLNTSGGPIENVLPKITALLPKGTEIHAAFVPAPPAPDVISSGDAVATFLRATTMLMTPVSKVGAPISSLAATASPADDFTPGIWEISGQRLPLEKAAALASNLGLRPVYLLTLPTSKSDPVATMGQLQADAMRFWLSMSPDQRTAAATNQFASLLSMPSADRQALLGMMMSQGKQMQDVMKNMPSDQRQAFMNDVMAAMRDAGINVPGGPGGGPGQGAGNGAGK